MTPEQFCVQASRDIVRAVLDSTPTEDLEMAFTSLIAGIKASALGLDADVMRALLGHAFAVEGECPRTTMEAFPMLATPRKPGEPLN